MLSNENLPFGIFVHVSVTLNGVLLDEELDSLVEAGRDGWGLLP